MVGVNLLDLQLPFLASRILLERLGCIIDMSEGTLRFTVLNVALMLAKRHGHLVACITKFPPSCSQMSCWSELREHVHQSPDPELHLSVAIREQGASARRRASTQ